MKGKGRSRLLEWGKSLLIILLAASAIYLLGETQFSEGMLGRVQSLLQSSASEHKEEGKEQAGPASVHPMKIAMMLEGGQRYGVQYDLTETDALYSSVSTLLAEALSSAGTPRKISERAWRSGLGEVGIYLDLHYPLPLTVLSGQLGNARSGTVSPYAVRRLCLAAGRDDSVDLLYIDETDGAFYSSTTTLSLRSHLEPVLAGRSANGAMFAFEVPGLENVAPYVLLTATPQPVKYKSENPLVSEPDRIEQLLGALSFPVRGNELDPLAGGLLVEGNDSLRLLETGVLTFHTLGDSEFRFLLSENSLQGVLNDTQKLSNATIGTWCGGASLCLAGVQETADGLEIRYQYCLNGIPVELPEGDPAARFVVRNGAITDFSLYFRSYSATEETTLILPERQAAAVLGSSDENELTLIYQDTGSELVSAGWIAN